MAFESKISLLNQIEKRIGSDVSFDTMPKIMSAISDILQSFEVVETVNRSNEPDDLLNVYLDALKVMGRSVKTIDRYAYVIRRMMESVKIPTRQITVYHLRSYLSKEQARGLQDSSLEGMREVFTAYFNWLHREGLIDKNPTANLGAIKRAKKQKQIYSDVENEKMDRCCMSIRDRAIVYLLRATGCRISDVTGLDRDNVDLGNRSALVHGKGNKERVVYFDDLTEMVLKEYFSERTDNNPALFIGRFGERLQPGGVRVMLNRLAEQAGVEHIHPHKFRRTWATNAARHGMPIQEVASIMGHEKLDTTMRYITLDNKDREYSYRRFVG